MKQGQKQNRFYMLIKGEAGQAAVEYILLCVIIVSLMIGMSKVFKTLDDGFNHYIGDYITCLMDFGELPSLGIQNSDLKKHAGGGALCDTKFGAFSFADGRPPTGGGNGSGITRNPSDASRNPSNRSGRDGADGTGTNSGKDGNKQAADDAAGDDGEGGSSLRGGRKKGKSPYQAGQIKNGSEVHGTLDGAGDGGDSKVRVVEDDSEAEDAKRRNRKRTRNISNNTRENYRAINGRMAQEIEKTQRKTLRRLPTSTVRTITTEEAKFRPYKKQFTPPVAKKAEDMDSKNTGFGFGNLIRWLFIAGMVIAIVIFFGGQLLNYSNSDS